ncbi:MAG: glycosyltransferase [Rhabdochlamydiaceae bacterium]|jgi:glycosyltransferase involved in cell wall biosynthesis
MNNDKKTVKIVIAFILIASLSFITFHRWYKKTKAPDVTVIESVMEANGPERVSTNFINTLKDSLDVQIKASHKFFKSDLPQEQSKSTKNRKKLVGKVIVYLDNSMLGKPPLTAFLSNNQSSNRIRIAYLMHKPDSIPDEWTRSLNKCFDLVAVPDACLTELYKNSGVTIPIFELPMGLNLEQFTNLPLKTTKHYPFIFAHLSTNASKRNQIQLIRAFYSTFGNSQDVKLRINSRFINTSYNKEIKNEIHRLGATNIDFTEINMDRDFYCKTLQTIDCYISLSLDEGISTHAKEAMALGIPTIFTDDTGNSKIYRSNLGRNIFSACSTSNNSQEISNDHASEEVISALKDVYENYNVYLQQKFAARNWVKQYSYDQLKPLVLGLIKPKKLS